MKKSLLVLSVLLLLFSAGAVEPQGRKTSSYAYSTGSSVPASCTAPALFYKTSTTQGLYQCVAGSYVALIGSSTGITGSGTSGTVTKFTGTSTVGNSVFSESGSDATIAPASAVNIGNSAAGLTGGIRFYGTTSGAVQLIAPATVTAGPIGLYLPGAQGASNTFMKNDGSGNLSFTKAVLTTDVSGTLPVANGGTGVAATTAYALLAGGTTTTGALQSLAGVGTAGQVLTSNGASMLPTFGTAPVAGGGTGLTSATAYALLAGGTTSTGAFQSLAGLGDAGQVLTSNGANLLPTFQAAAGGVAPIIQPSSKVPVTSGSVFENVYIASGSGHKHTAGLGIANATTITADSIWSLEFDLPPVLPSGTATLETRCIANLTSGALKVNVKWNVCAVETDCSSVTLNAEGTQTITWGAGDADQWKQLQTVLDASTMTADTTLLMNYTIEDTGTTIADTATCKVYLTWR